MPVIDLDKREFYTLQKRKNFASRNPGVILVFCIVGAIVLLLIGLWAHKKIQARRKASNL